MNNSTICHFSHAIDREYDQKRIFGTIRMREKQIANSMCRYFKFSHARLSRA
jgi:hypothetical protein